MAQSASGKDTIYSLQVQEDLWFNLAPITKSTRDFYNNTTWHEKTEQVGDGSGFNSFFLAIKKYFEHAESDPNVTLYAFLATHEQYKGGAPLEENTVEMFWSVTMDAQHKFSNHMGAQKFIVDNSHSRISAMGHSFCASMTKMLHPEIKLMLFAPMPVMRYIIFKALKVKALEDGMSIEWWDEEYADIRKTKTLRDKAGEMQREREELEASGKEASFRFKALEQFYKILLTQWESDNNFLAYEYEEGVTSLKCMDGTKVTFKGTSPDWFGRNPDNISSGEKSHTILSIAKLASVWGGFDSERLEETTYDETVAAIGDAMEHLAAE